MRRFVAAITILVIGFSVAMAEEFGATIKKVDGTKITINKSTKKDKVDDSTLTVTDNVKVLKGKFDKETKKLEAGDAIEGGLKNEMFSKEVRARITTNDDGKVTQIIVGGGKKKN